MTPCDCDFIKGKRGDCCCNKRYTKIESPTKLLVEFERTILLAKARALSKLSLERPLTDIELEQYEGTMKKIMEAEQ